MSKLKNNWYHLVGSANGKRNFTLKCFITYVQGTGFILYFDSYFYSSFYVSLQMIDYVFNYRLRKQ